MSATATRARGRSRRARAPATGLRATRGGKTDLRLLGRSAPRRPCCPRSRFTALALPRPAPAPRARPPRPRAPCGPSSARWAKGGGVDVLTRPRHSTPMPAAGPWVDRRTGESADQGGPAEHGPETRNCIEEQKTHTVWDTVCAPMASLVVPPVSLVVGLRHYSRCPCKLFPDYMRPSTPQSLSFCT